MINFKFPVLIDSNRGEPCAELISTSQVKGPTEFKPSSKPTKKKQKEIYF